MDIVDEMAHDVNNLYNITTSLASQSKLLLIGTPLQICLSKPLQFTILCQNSLHAYNGLH